MGEAGGELIASTVSRVAEQHAFEGDCRPSTVAAVRLRRWQRQRTSTGLVGEGIRCRLLEHTPAESEMGDSLSGVGIWVSRAARLRY